MAWDRWLYFPSEGRRAEDFFALKIRWLRTGLNPQTWVLKASKLPLDHRSRHRDNTKHIKNLCNIIMAIMITMTMINVPAEKLE